MVQQLPKQHSAFTALGTKFPVPGQPGGELEELFILEALRVAKQAVAALSRPQSDLSAIHAALLKEFPLIAARLQEVLQESNCVLQ